MSYLSQVALPDVLSQTDHPINCLGVTLDELIFSGILPVPFSTTLGMSWKGIYTILWCIVTFGPPIFHSLIDLVYYCSLSLILVLIYLDYFPCASHDHIVFIYFDITYLCSHLYLPTEYS